MKSLLFVVVIMVVLGCEPPPAAPPPNPPAQTPVATTTSKPEEEKKTELPASLKKHPERVYALENLAKADLNAAGHTIHAWIMDTDGKRTEGMMFLQSADVADDQGMIFVFPGERTKDESFWMHDTPLPLDIIYIGKDKKVVNVGVGKPESDAQVKAEGPYQYVLELKQGTAAKLGIKKGSLVEMPASVKTTE